MSDHPSSSTVILTRPRERNGTQFTLPWAHHWPEAVARALAQPNGARDYRCALQVNTPMQNCFKGFDSKYRRDSEPFQRDFALALAQRCKKAGIDAIGLCDHNSVAYVEIVRRELRQEGIVVFPGFEVASTEGLHVLCLFDLEAPVEELDHLLTELGLPPKDRWVNGRGLAPRQSPKSFPQILEIIQKDRRGICIAAHMDRENGLLFECAKTTRVQYFTDPNLLAGQIAGARADLRAFERKIVEGQLNHYRRERPLALVNCLDVYNLKDIENPACSTLIKMSTPGIEALWQAFLDPESRLELLTESAREGARPAHRSPHVELVAMTWEGEASFLHGCAIHFNENLNCLIGGRGTGKSTVIESLRYVLDQPPLGEQARRMHESILAEVVKSGTKISLLVRSNQPSPSYYLIERLYPGEPAIYDETGQRRRLQVFDIVPGIAIFGQHEIAEIARDTNKQAQLLVRYRAETAATLEAGRRECNQLLEANRKQLLAAQAELHEIAEKLAHLPVLQEKLRLFENKGIEAKLREQALLTREEQILLSSREHLQALQRVIEQARKRLEVEPVSLPAGPVLPNGDLIAQAQTALQNLEQELAATLSDLAAALGRTQSELLVIMERWQNRRQARQKEYERTLMDLQREEIDGAAFLRLRQEIERLEPLRFKHAQLRQRCQQLEKKRQQLLQRRQAGRKKLFALDQKAAGRVNRLLHGRLRVTLEPAADFTPLFDKLRSLRKRLQEDFFERLAATPGFSQADFLKHLRAGKAALQARYQLTDRQAEVLAHLDAATMLELEELDLPDRVTIELNVAAPHETPRWRRMPDLSTGQKATAILLLLFPESRTPLVIDQPEDDLDNRFIADTIIPTLRQEKRRRQFLFATHNANIPVLGDAELIIALETGGEGKSNSAVIREGNVGAIDRESVKLLVEQVLEGGQRAFELRRAKYGF
ncbi:MAG: AAA family ATPase [candidate division KSB1 bacterium]|nr:AAA family ATPase [candidate division KSB1 bacterium]MDZ7275420.1 AAA family ATPase [candidate division KSB1 bacterium]MDZ7286268.1 AAA family ATPase [candidate division KSB1 bacterium]MDZ7296494.1 AAA family ATPase [candidate division KSB1 bacterium]MDZ7305548.1 AAA family ATPase [candidate division KSB1 bacterium]